MLKEIYLFVWFTAAAVFLSLLTAQELSRVLRVWGVVAVLHGLFMIAQFLSPELWKITNSLGENVVEHEIYRPSGLFICGHAGCANKAAIFQFLGFVPLVLAGFSKRVVTTMGMVLFLSILITGSMGATLAFLSGVIVAVVAMAVVKKNLLVLIGYFVRALLAIVMFGGLFYAIISLNPRYKTHFERIIVGRFDKSSGSRFNLWQRGLGVLIDHNALFWGVGPENFRVLDPAQTENQLHNDPCFSGRTGVDWLVGVGFICRHCVTQGVFFVADGR